MRRAATTARAALVVVWVGLSVASLIFGRDAGPCREVYLQSGLTRQRMTFAEFRESYSGTICAKGGGPHAYATELVEAALKVPPGKE